MHGSINIANTSTALTPPTTWRADERYREVFAAHRVSVFRLAAMLVGDWYVAEEVTAEGGSTSAGSAPLSFPAVVRGVVPPAVS